MTSLTSRHTMCRNQRLFKVPKASPANVSGESGRGTSENSLSRASGSDKSDVISTAALTSQCVQGLSTCCR